MTLAGESSAHFSELEPEELEDYRPLNRPSLIGLVLAIASPLALFHSVLWLIPVVGIVASLIGLRQLRQEDLRQSGRTLAILGLVISLIVLSWSVSRHISRQNYLYARARIFGEAWLDLLRQQKYEEAHQLTLIEGRRIERGQSLKKHYEPRERPKVELDKGRPTDPDAAEKMMAMMEPSPRDEMDGFYKLPMVERVRNLGNTAKFKFISNLRISKAGSSAERIYQLYEVSGKQHGISTSFLFVITLERSTLTGPGDWRVEGLSEASGL